MRQDSCGCFDMVGLRYARYGDTRPPVQPLRVASVIAGQLRGMTDRTNVARVNWLTKESDVFICTDRLYQEEIGSLTGVVGTRFIEEDPSWKEKVNLTKELQWWRLQQCWDMIQDFEAEHGFSYAFYMKIRTDCYKRGGCEPSRKTYDKIREDFGPQLDDKIFARSNSAEASESVASGSHVVLVIYVGVSEIGDPNTVPVP